MEENDLASQSSSRSESGRVEWNTILDLYKSTQDSDSDSDSEILDLFFRSCTTTPTISWTLTFYQLLIFIVLLSSPRLLPGRLSFLWKLHVSVSSSCSLAVQFINVIIFVWSFCVNDSEVVDSVDLRIFIWSAKTILEQ